MDTAAASPSLTLGRCLKIEPATYDFTTSPPLPTHQPQPRATTPHPQNNRIFVRLPEQHSARKMHPYALLQKLRGQLPKDAQLKEVQKIPTGFALHPNNTNASLAILQSQNKILEILEGATIEAEEKWVMVIIPNAPTTIQSFEGDN